MSRLIFALLCLSLSGCTSLVFQPQRAHLLDPAKLGITTRDVYFQTPDGVSLHGWFLPAQGEIQGSVVFLHGNAENVSTHLGSVFWLPKFGYNVFLFDYRGYGRSGGTPSLEGVHIDVESALDKVFEMKSTEGYPVILFGQSLGGALAVTSLVRSRHKACVDALVIEGAFTSYRTVARDALGNFWLTWPFQWPLSFTISDTYRPIDDIAKVSPIPLLIIHGTSDEVIPIYHAEALYRVAKSPKKLWIVPGASHIGVLKEEQNRRAFVARLHRLLALPHTTAHAAGASCRAAASSGGAMRLN